MKWKTYYYLSTKISFFFISLESLNLNVPFISNFGTLIYVIEWWVD